MNDRQFLALFEAAAIPGERWTHRAHVRMAFLYLRDLPFEQALTRIRSGIQVLNHTNQVPENDTSGYHETLTVAWATWIRSTLAVHGPTSRFGAFISANPHLRHKSLLRLYYSRDRMLSPQARFTFIDPDLAPLPNATGQSSGDASGPHEAVMA